MIWARLVPLLNKSTRNHFSTLQLEDSSLTTIEKEYYKTRLTPPLKGARSRQERESRTRDVCLRSIARVEILHTKLSSSTFNL